jgi:hypothetical protein
MWHNYARHASCGAIQTVQGHTIQNTPYEMTAYEVERGSTTTHAYAAAQNTF